MKVSEQFAILHSIDLAMAGYEAYLAGTLRGMRSRAARRIAAAHADEPDRLFRVFRLIQAHKHTLPRGERRLLRMLRSHSATIRRRLLDEVDALERNADADPECDIESTRRLTTMMRLWLHSARQGCVLVAMVGEREGRKPLYWSAVAESVELAREDLQECLDEESGSYESDTE